MDLVTAVHCPLCRAELTVSVATTGLHSDAGDYYVALHVREIKGCAHVDPPPDDGEGERVPGSIGAAIVGISVRAAA